jgi:hypothetical protein
MRVHKTVLVAAILAAGVAPAGIARAQDSRAVTAQPVAFTTEQLDNLVAPIALYPDAILAQVLIAATFPDQLEFAARYVKSHGTNGIDDQNWDVSVKAVAHYPPVLNMLADRDDWTTALGQAYAVQSSDVMESVQHLREMAREQGNLQSTQQQTVITEGNNIRIVPAQPQVIYVPSYDPEIIYYRPAVYVGAYSGFWSFGVGFPIGAWLSYDCDWYGRRVYYDGWRGDGWRVRSYPYIFVNTVYVHPRYETVYYNRDAWRRPVNYGNFGRYNTVHRTVTWTDRGRDSHSPGPIPRGVGNNDGRRDDGRNQARNDGRNDGRTDGRNDGRTAGRTDGRAPVQNGGRVPTQGQPQRDDPRTAHDRTTDRSPERGTVMSRPPMVVDRAARPQVERRSAPPSGEQRSAPPVYERRSAPPSVERPSAPPMIDRRSAPPSVERRSAPPSVERRAAPQVQQRSAPPSVERRSAPPSVERRSAPPSRSSAPAQSRGQSSRSSGDSKGKGSRGR